MAVESAKMHSGSENNTTHLLYSHLNKSYHNLKTKNKNKNKTKKAKGRYRKEKDMDAGTLL